MAGYSGSQIKGEFGNGVWTAHINEILIAGVISCLVMDTFQRLLFITHKIPPSNWGMVGRWTAYLFTRGKLINREIDNLPAISGETLAWLAGTLSCGYRLCAGVFWPARDRLAG